MAIQLENAFRKKKELQQNVAVDFIYMQVINDVEQIFVLSLWVFVSLGQMWKGDRYL